ncbi:hypothetical protein AFLA_001750 [Aspergillus flavus NRRL3357]|nr:hypothetical protein AFLA_001750 [Aspergillus flavus NRRL3357]
MAPQWRCCVLHHLALAKSNPRQLVWCFIIRIPRQTIGDDSRVQRFPATRSRYSCRSSYKKDDRIISVWQAAGYFPPRPHLSSNGLLQSWILHYIQANPCADGLSRKE